MVWGNVSLQILQAGLPCQSSLLYICRIALKLSLSGTYQSKSFLLFRNNLRPHTPVCLAFSLIWAGSTLGWRRHAA